ncbi:MAG: hypothetical protein K2X43_13685 [Hyphomonadaceae bacterium]|nr:hypothetical protein [Hyphomonadaceae bacterium]
MAYKGSDLDLRAPHHSRAGEDAGTPTSWSWPADGAREGPIAVDQSVLAVCNAAFDAALFHGSREVRVDHLLYALTRVDAACALLEQHKVRAHQLRRDAAAAMAAEAPAAGAGSRVPRRSAELENLLRRAVRAGQDNGPASVPPVTVSDVLRAVLSQGGDAAALLLRSADDSQALERWAFEPPLTTTAAASLQPAVAQELLVRLETMEAAMHTLAAEVAADRKAMLDLMGEIQHELRSARDEARAAQPAIVLDKIEDVGRSVTELSDRFEAIRALAPGEGVNDLAGRLTALEGKISEQPSAITDAVAYLLTEHRVAGEDGSTPGGDIMAERLSALERMLLAQAERMEDAGKMHERDLGEIFEALVKLGTNQQTLANNLEAWRLDSSGDVSIVSNRLENMERTLQATLSPLLQLESHEDGNGARSGNFKRWLYGTGRVLPSTWRDDAAALRESFRSQRRIGKS